MVFTFADQCTMSRISMLLTRFCYKAWIFGAIYYWCSWAYLAVGLIFDPVFDTHKFLTGLCILYYVLF